MAVAGSGLLQPTAARNKTEIVPLLWMTARRGRAIAALSTMNMILTHVQHVICLALEKREKGAKDIVCGNKCLFFTPDA